jgi:predicted transposase YbfD/YdcC
MERTRSCVIHRTGTCTQATTYAISSRSSAEATPERQAQVDRKHWHIENCLHGQRDVRMKEDANRTHVGNAPMGLAVLRNWAINVVHMARRRTRRLAHTWDRMRSFPRIFAILRI